MSGCGSIRLVGSSPHVRGALCRLSRPTSRGGIIPACAGSTEMRVVAFCIAGDHPRMCGEHVREAMTLDGDPGSSPHVRGAHVGRADDVRADGIIPACAGSTKRSLDHEDHQEDHPRMCGEHPLTVMWTVMASGSSPHVRGARECWRRFRCGLGIIPACAGSTRREIRLPHFRRDHPRMCGEHDTCCCRSSTDSGSSPHVRGARPCGRLGKSVSGIIPACAGSTIMQRASANNLRDHPRMCGEHTSKIA